MLVRDGLVRREYLTISVAGLSGIWIKYLAPRCVQPTSKGSWSTRSGELPITDCVVFGATEGERLGDLNDSTGLGARVASKGYIRLGENPSVYTFTYLSLITGTNMCNRLVTTESAVSLQ